MHLLGFEDLQETGLEGSNIHVAQVSGDCVPSRLLALSTPGSIE